MRIIKILKRHGGTKNPSPFLLQIDRTPNLRFRVLLKLGIEFFIFLCVYIFHSFRAPIFAAWWQRYIVFRRTRFEGSAVATFGFLLNRGPETKRKRCRIPFLAIPSTVPMRALELTCKVIKSCFCEIYEIQITFVEKSVCCQRGNEP